MQCDEAITILRRGQAALREHGVRSLSIFGSTARGDARYDSDIDLLLELEEGRRYSVIDLSKIKFLASDLLGRRVDVALRGGLRPAYRSAIENDAVRVF
ncbi:MAG TPA: nucleotidyltransferase domain-containing protein [Rhizomicrobium sp.]|nr:nucleotidyltransferase domain-containing protein [Rhizomicrobium sp.]